jgi:DNA modification methylase
MTVNAIDQAHGDAWSAYHGDSAEVLPGLPSESVDLITTSVPFDDLFVYTASERDIGNCRSTAEFFDHLGYVTRECYRLLKPGRVAAFHVMDIPAEQGKDGYIGLKDFSGDLIRHLIEVGFQFQARIPIDKNQQAVVQTKHVPGLNFADLERDRAVSRPAFPDYILKFRKPGTNAVRIADGDVDRDTWIAWASPSWPDEHDRCGDAGAFATWYGIEQTDTLNALVRHGYAGLKASRDTEDGRHVCPLQLGTIERCVRLWSLPGEVVLDPFGGIGSVMFRSVQLGRRAIQSELKPLYHRSAAWNLRRLEESMRVPDLFSMLAGDDLARVAG